MGTRPRHRPERLGEKLLEIRNALGLSQSELLKRLEADEDLAYYRVSEYESDKREPPLWLLLAYAHAAGVHLEDIVDDDLDLPNKLPGNVNYRGLKRKPLTRRSEPPTRRR